MSQVKHQRALAVTKLALIGVPLGIAFMFAGRGTVVGGQDPAGPGRGQAPATGRGAAANQGHNVTRPDLPNPFRFVENIVTMPPGRTMGSTNAINVDSKGNIWVFERCGVNSCADSNLESNRRIVHLSKDGKFIEAWGSKGTGPLQFDNPHAIALDSKGRIFVGDRTNNRIQILSPRGEFIAEWRQFGRPSGVRIHNDILYVADSESRNVPGQYGYNPGFHRGIYIGSVNDGVVTAFIPDPRPNGGASFPEGISVDKSGTLWGASIGDRKVLKFVKN